MELKMKCDCCGSPFVSKKVRAGDKLCLDCVELRRALKGFVKRGLSKEVILKRAAKMI